MLIASIPLLYFWRFRNTPLDRDFTPYYGPAIFKVGYLTNGFIDIKSPLLHWSAKIWLWCVSPLKLSLILQVRMMSALISSLALFAMAYVVSIPCALILALLMFTPTSWQFMAQTEWLTVCLIVWAMLLAPIQPALALIVLGLLPWANQKNAVLIPFLFLTLPLSLTPISIIWLTLPSIFLGSYLIATNRLETFWYHCFVLPAHFAKNRKLSINTPLSLLRGWIWEAVPFLAICDWHNPWMLVLAVMVVGTILTKQITPQHFIPFALPIAMSARPDALPMALVAWLIVWALRSRLAWQFPAQIYALTFSYAGKGDYGVMLKDADSIEAWLRDNTKPDEEIWVNGMENQIYLNAMRKPWYLNIPELTTVPEGTPPRIVVHCANSALKNFNYDKWGYMPALTADPSRLGLFTILERGTK